MRVFSIGFTSASLTAEEVWPDGDGPEDPSAKDVAERIAEYGFYRTISDWFLVDELTVTDGRGGIVDVSEDNRVRVRGETKLGEGK